MPRAPITLILMTILSATGAARAQDAGSPLPLGEGLGVRGPQDAAPPGDEPSSTAPAEAEAPTTETAETTAEATTEATKTPEATTPSQPTTTTAPTTAPTTAQTTEAVPTKKPAPAPQLDVHAGLNLRTDLGVHPFRLDGGVRYGAFDAVLVVDPMFWTDGQMSTDLLLNWRSDVNVQAIVGWRVTSLGIVGGTQFQQNLLLGVGMDLPTFFDGTVRGQWGLELAMLIVKSGGDLPAEFLNFSSARRYIDFVNFAMFARFEYALPWEL